MRLLRWWKQRQRALDLELLWPTCKSQAPDLDFARGIFFVHMQMDPAYNDLTEDEKIAYCEALK